MRFIIILLILLPGFKGRGISSYQKVYSDLIADNNIKTVKIYRENWDLSYPVIKLNSEERLVLKFDLIADQPENYYYTFVHCDKDWNESGLFVYDYIDGFDENPIEDYKPSFNTTVNYYHYSLTFPNERAKLKVSGNYALVVYVAGNRDKPVITRRFMITEDAVQIEISAHRPKMTADNNTHQQIDFTVNYSGYPMYDPYRNVYATILQNGRWDIARTNLKPDIQGNNELIYSSLSDKAVFPGGNEFRYFDIKSIRYKSENVRDVEFFMSNYNVYLQPSDDREFKPYFYQQDLNGKYIIAFQEGRDAGTDGDYVNVYFTLPSDRLDGGEVYIAGALTDWKLNDISRMTYNNREKQYESTIMLKQGWYNYEYVFLRDGEENAVRGPFEGNHYETENDYVVLVYYRNPRERYDRLVGTVIGNTLNRIRD